jgi:MoxR-like ATPase
MKLLALVLIFLQLGLTVAVAAPVNPGTCDAQLSAKAKPQISKVSAEQAWATSQKSLSTIKKKIIGQDHAINVVLANAISEQFTWLNGDPGGAKTMIARKVFESLLETVTEGEKRIFLIQFHKLVSEGKITGFAKIKSLLEKGKYEIETSQSLVGDRFLFLIADEAEKSNPATLNAMLSVLNERAAFHGSRVVKAILAAGVFTSNKSISEFLDSFGEDRAAGEALLDRMGMKAHVLNQQMNAEERNALYQAVHGAPDKAESPLYFSELKSVMNSVVVPDSLVQDIAKILWNFDVFVTAKMRDSDLAFRSGSRPQEYFPPNQFSNRSLTRIVKLLKAAYVVTQMSTGVDLKNLRREMNRSDLPLLAWTATYNMGGPVETVVLDLSSYQSKTANSPKGMPVLTGGSIPSEVGFNAEYLPADWNPFKNELIVYAKMRREEAGRIRFDRDKNGNLTVRPSTEKFLLQPDEVEEVIAAIKAAETAAKIDINTPVFRPSPKISQALGKGTLPTRTRNELKDIFEDQEAFVGFLNTQLNQAAGANAPAKVVTRNVPKTSLKLTTEDAYNLSVQAVKELNEDFHEVDYAVEALLTSILAKEHVYMFGPPGGAKTALSQAVLKRVIKSMKRDQARVVIEALLPKLKKDQTFIKQVLAQMRSENRRSFEIFMLQFHKLLPEGVITGFPKLQAMLDTGVEEIDFSTSLAAEKFIFAILDETDKANPQTLTALLSILNERLVFSGSSTFKAGLLTAVMTSNKMTSEMLDSFFDDRSAGEAFLDRVTNKVLVMNKMSTIDATIELMRSFLPGAKKSPQVTEMPLDRLEELVDKVTIGEEVISLLSSIHEKFLAKRLTEQEESFRRSQIAKKEFPDYYVMASSPSDRTYLKLMKQLKSRLIARQISAGVAFKDLKFKFDLDELPLFFEGLGYWTPGVIEKTYDQNGVLQFKLQRTVVEEWLKTARVSRRVSYFLEQSLAEGQAFTEIVNFDVYEFINEMRQALAQMPHLFPELFKDGDARVKVLNSTNSTQPTTPPGTP